MSERAENPPEDQAPGCGAAALAMTAATLPIAAGVTIASGWFGLFLPIFIVTLAIVAVFGTLSFVAIRGRVSAVKVVCAGFATGAIVPVIGVLMSGIGAAGVLAILSYGFAGAIGALITWSLLLWQMHHANAGKWIAGSTLFAVVLLALVL